METLFMEAVTQMFALITGVLHYLAEVTADPQTAETFMALLKAGTITLVVVTLLNMILSQITGGEER